MSNPIDREAAIDAVNDVLSHYIPLFRNDQEGIPLECARAIMKLPSVQSEEVIPHRNYKYLSDYWCECGNHLGKKGDVKYCSDCGKRVKWDE